MNVREVEPPEGAVGLLSITGFVIVAAIPLGILSRCASTYSPKTTFIWDEPAGQIIVWLLLLVPIGLWLYLRSTRKIGDDEIGVAVSNGQPLAQVLRPGKNIVSRSTKVYAFKNVPFTVRYEDEDMKVECTAKPDENAAQLWLLKQCAENVERRVEERIEEYAEDAGSPEEVQTLLESKRLADFGLALVELKVRPKRKAEKKPTDLAKLETDLRSAGLPEDRIRQIIEQTRLEMLE